MGIDEFLKESKESVADDESKPWRSSALKPKPVASKPTPPPRPKKVAMPAVKATDAWGQADKLKRMRERTASAVRGSGWKDQTE